MLRILYQDTDLIAVDKPSGYHVHPPEDTRHRISPTVNCLHILRNQIGQYLYPVHRLDRATSGVLIFALNPESARNISNQFSTQKVKKTYYCVVRGWVDSEGKIQHPLKDTLSGTSADTLIGEITLQESETHYEGLARVEVPFATDRYLTSRYSLVRVTPLTGRRHQIRRHFAHLSHPLIGDTLYGKGMHNRIFKEELKIPGLLLKAYRLRLNHPTTNEPVEITSRWNHHWHSVFDLFGVCPLDLPV